MTRCKIFQLDASYSPPHPSYTRSSHPTPPPSPSSHIGREVSLSLLPRALLLCHQVTSPASSLSGRLSQVTQPGCEAFLLYFHKQNRKEATVMRKHNTPPPVRYWFPTFS